MNDSDSERGQFVLLSREVDCLRRDLRRAKVAFTATILSMASVIAIQSLWGPKNIVAASANRDGIMRVRGLIIEDAKGTERLRLGAPLPDPMGADGVRHRRQGPISGMILSDATGTERAGFATDDQFGETFLGLDSRKGQEVLFLENPDGGTNFVIFDSKGNEAALTVFPSGPKLVLKKAKQVVAQLPEK